MRTALPRSNRHRHPRTSKPRRTDSHGGKCSGQRCCSSCISSCSCWSPWQCNVGKPLASKPPRGTSCDASALPSCKWKATRVARRGLEAASRTSVCLVPPATRSLGQVPPLLRSIRISPRPPHLRRCIPVRALAREPLHLVCIVTHVLTCAFHHHFRSATTAPPMPPGRPKPLPSSTCRSSVSRTATIPSSTEPRDVDGTRRRATGSETRAKAPTPEPSSSPSSSASVAAPPTK
mmetsp:Transcript_10878/g.67191  ORF Transcript_10878/g.67191 Transcript_10878/m.67191 type:complete len:234 (+) Transcript_10878:1364-2065(+)